MVVPDDHENFERMAENFAARGAPKRPFNYAMTVAHDAEDARPPEIDGADQWPGHIVPPYSETIQRDFYRYWGELMQAA